MCFSWIMSRKLCYDHPIIAGVFNREVFMVTHKVKFAITLLVGFFALIVTSVSVGETPIKVDLKSSSEGSLGPVLGDYRVAKGDTLWKVSERARPEGATVWQTMDAIFIGNPRSFLYDDASKIIINTVIKLPTSEQASIQSGRFVSDELKRTVYLENSDVEAKKFTDAERADGLSEVFVGSSSESLTVLDNTDQEAKSYAVTKTPVDAEDSQLIPYRNEVDVMNAVKVDSVDSLEQDRLRAVAQVELENEALREEVLVLTTKLQALTQPVKLEADTIELVAEKTQIKESNVAIAWIENQPWYIASLLAALATMLGFFVHKSVRREVPVTESTLADIYDEPSQSQVEVTEIVFDETDGDIFAGPDDEANLSGFDLMVDPVSEAEVHLSLGQLKEALDILETARNNDSDDMSSRLKLMEIYLSEELPEPLVALHQEINSSEDEISIKKAELILTSRLQQGQSILQVNEQASMSDTDIGVNITPEDFPEIDGSFDSEVLESMNALEQSQTTDLSDMEYLDEFQDINPVDIKLDLAATYADLGDKQGARAILNEIIADASKADKSKAQAILDQLDL